MAAWTYLAADLRTGQVLDELPLRGVSFGSVLNGVGDFTGTLDLASASARDIPMADLRAATEPQRTLLLVDRDSVLLWAGIIWARAGKGSDRARQLSALEVWSYFRRRINVAALDFTGVDQGTIIKTVVDLAQAAPGGNIGVNVPAPDPSVARDRHYAATDLKGVADLVEQMTQVEQGPDFAVDVAYVNDTPTLTFRLGWPRRGRAAPDTGWVFELGGNMVDYDEVEDGTGGGNAVYAVGAGEGPAMLVSSVTETAVLDAGYPLLDQVTQYNDVTDQSTLDAHARGDLLTGALPARSLKIRVRADTDPVLGSWAVGDDCIVVIEDDWYPDGYTAPHRILASKITPGDGTAPEDVELTLGDAL